MQKVSQSEFLNSTLYYNNINIDNITNAIKIKENNNQKLWKIFKQGCIFLVFSFINSFFPLFICCISSLINYSGAQVVMGIGYAATFQLSFAQLGITFAISLFFLFNLKRKNFDNDNSNFLRSLFCTFIVGCISMFIYILSSYLYLNYSNNRPNTLDTIKYGLDFVYSSAGFCLLSSIEAYLFLLICRRRKYITVILFLFRSALMLILCYILGVCTNLKAVGIGLSLTIVILISTISSFFYIIYKYRYSLLTRVNLFPKGQHLLKQIAQESISGLSLSLAKGIGILCLNLLMTAKLTSYIPLSYQMARVIWFNLMYAIPWLGYGLSDAIKYNDLYDIENNSWKNKQYLIMNYWILFIISMIFATLFAISGYFLVEPLANLYIKNSHFNGIVPPLEGLNPELQKIFINCLPPTNFPTISKNETFNTYINKLFNDPQWNEWIKKLNLAMGQQGIKHWFENWINLANNFDAFKQWFINYVSSTSYNADVIKALIIYKTPSEINNVTTPLLFAFKNANFNAKAYIYICIYGILCSGWSVLLPSSAVIEQKQFPPFLLAIIYFLAIAFIIGFGATFSITNIATKLGNNNPFRYLDAWTFPVAIVAFCVFSYVLIKWIFISHKVYKECKNELN